VTARAAIVTGASAGIGLAVCEALVRQGYAVTMVARDAARIEAAAAQFAESGDVTAMSADAGDESALAEVVGAHLDWYGRIDAVVANAGFGGAGTVADTQARHLERAWRANVAAPFALARLAMPSLRRAGDEHGRAWFVVTASISGVHPSPGFAAYSASKAAAVSLAQSIAAEEASHGVRACALCPAFVDTAMTEWTRDSVPADSMLQPADVAETVGYLLRLSPAASVTEIVIGRTGQPRFSP
jgi:NAD(P)-dependent dehydrogenase (short-subunit alcohol dehydrogenase family)